MKKHLVSVLVFTLAAGIMVGCGTTAKKETEVAVTEVSSEEVTAEETTSETVDVEETTVAEVTVNGYKTGLAVISSLEKSKDAGDADGNAQIDSVAVAVVLDENDKIVKCVIDTAQNKMAFTADGKVIMTDSFQTKKELGDDYGMKAASGIGKEWFEQITVLEEYVIGKTVEEIKGIAINEDTVPEEADLTSSVTIKIGDYVDGIAQAAADAKVMGTNAEDTLSLGIVTDMEKSKDAEQDKEGQAQAYSTYAAVTTDRDGVITASIIDCTQGTVTFDHTGKITSDLTEAVKTKRQLGDDYGMKAASGIGKEWFEQAEAFSQYIAGKTIEDINGIAIDEDNRPTEVDLTSSVTITIGNYQKAIEKAVSK